MGGLPNLALRLGLCRNAVGWLSHVFTYVHVDALAVGAGCPRMVRYASSGGGGVALQVVVWFLGWLCLMELGDWDGWDKARITQRGGQIPLVGNVWRTSAGRGWRRVWRP